MKKRLAAKKTDRLTGSRVSISSAARPKASSGVRARAGRAGPARELERENMKRRRGGVSRVREIFCFFRKKRSFFVRARVLETLTRCGGKISIVSRLTHDASSDEEHGQRRRSGDLCDLSRRKSRRTKEGARRR